MGWESGKITEVLRKYHRRGYDLSYNAMQRRDQPLVSAAAYHCGSYRRACEKAGLDYAEISRRPRWTKPKIIRVLKAAYRAEEDLHWSAVTRRKDDLGKAAFASLQPRLFGSWDRALHAAGLDADLIAMYRSWDRATVVADLKALHADNGQLNSGALQKQDPGLHAAAIRHFRTYDAALRAAGIDPASARLRRSWSREQVIAEFRKRRRAKLGVTDTAVRREFPALYGAALRLFGNFSAAREKAGLSRT